MENDYDIPECIPTQQYQMRRLLALMGFSQDECTDVQCLTPGTMRTAEPNDSPYSMLMIIMLVAAIVMYFLNPRSVMRITVKQSEDGSLDADILRHSRASRRGDGDNDQPPPAIN